MAGLVRFVQPAEVGAQVVAQAFLRQPFEMRDALDDCFLEGGKGSAHSQRASSVPSKRLGGIGWR